MVGFHFDRFIDVEMNRARAIAVFRQGMWCSLRAPRMASHNVRTLLYGGRGAFIKTPHVLATQPCPTNRPLARPPQNWDLGAWLLLVRHIPTSRVKPSAFSSFLSVWSAVASGACSPTSKRTATARPQMTDNLIAGWIFKIHEIPLNPLEAREISLEIGLCLLLGRAHSYNEREPPDPRIFMILIKGNGNRVVSTTSLIWKLTCS